MDAEADHLCGAKRYEQSAARVDARAGHYERQLHTKAGEVTLKVPKLRSLPFESAIIERYKRREISVEEALVEMYLAGVSVRRVEDITQALWGTRVSPSTVSAPRRATARGPRRHTATGARTTMISSVRAGRQHRLHDHRGSHGYGRFPSLRAGDTLPKPVDRRRYRNLHNIIHPCGATTLANMRMPGFSQPDIENSVIQSYELWTWSDNSTTFTVVKGIHPVFHKGLVAAAVRRGILIHVFAPMDESKGQCLVMINITSTDVIILCR